jgi:hypothetical protein
MMKKGTFLLSKKENRWPTIFGKNDQYTLDFQCFLQKVKSNITLARMSYPHLKHQCIINMKRAFDLTPVIKQEKTFKLYAEGLKTSDF